MSYREFTRWIQFANKHGVIDAGRRIESTMALIAARFAGAYLKKQDGSGFTMAEFMPFAPDEPDQEASLMEVFSLLKSKALESPE